MALRTIKVLCEICQKERGIFKCDGCSKVFCLKHTNDHRQDINKQLDQIEKQSDVLKEILSQYTTEQVPDTVIMLQNEILKKIDHWEDESINKCKLAAEEARKDLLKLTSERWTILKQKLDVIKDEILENQRQQDFMESDIQEWDSRLKILKENWAYPKTITFYESSKTLINKMLVLEHNGVECFEQTSGNTVFSEDKALVTVVQNDVSMQYSEIRGKAEYFTGSHSIHFNIEELPLNSWIFMGIISKSTPLIEHSYESSSSYGWYNGMNFVYAAGNNIGGRGLDVIQGDSVHLFIDCDHQLIRITNLRTSITLELSVCINKCPLPWQCHLNLHLPGTRIRILS